ncbi:hypothetical protein ABKN59_012043, partial [Abortiporus biennis]
RAAAISQQVLLRTGQVSKEAYPDYTAWDKDHPYYDEKTDKDNPKWFMIQPLSAIYFQITSPYRAAFDISDFRQALIEQLEALQTMAKSASSKVIFVPMQLQSDVIGQLQTNQPEAGPSMSSDGVTRAGLLNSISDV